jgi:hypothetical protein
MKLTNETLLYITPEPSGQLFVESTVSMDPGRQPSHDLPPSQVWHASNAFTQLCIAVTNGHTVRHRWLLGTPHHNHRYSRCVLPKVSSALRRVHAYGYCYWCKGQALLEHPTGSQRGPRAIQAGDVAASGRGAQPQAVIIERDRVATAEAAAQSTAYAAHSGSLATAVQALLNAGPSAATSWLWQEPLQHGGVLHKQVTLPPGALVL